MDALRPSKSGFVAREAIGVGHVLCTWLRFTPTRIKGTLKCSEHRCARLEASDETILMRLGLYPDDLNVRKRTTVSATHRVMVCGTMMYIIHGRKHINAREQVLNAARWQ